MADLFSDLMPEINHSLIESRKWNYDYMTLLGNLCRREVRWKRLIDTMPIWSAYVVVCKESWDVKKRKDEWGTDIVYDYWTKALALFITKYGDILFEIDEDLVRTLLIKHSLQQKVLLQEYVLQQLPGSTQWSSITSAPLEYTISGTSMFGQRSSSSGRSISPQYNASTLVSLEYMQWPLWIKVRLNAILGKPLEQWK